MYVYAVYATGLDDEDLKKAQVGISSVWYEGNPCNMHLLDLAQKVKEGVAKAGLIGYRFNTIGVSDGISMGTSGMRYSLQSRDLIADSIETVSVHANWSMESFIYSYVCVLQGHGRTMVRRQH